VATLSVVSRERPEDLSAFDLWNDPAWQRFGQVRSLALAGEHFSGRLEHGSIGFLSICRITATAHRVEHDARSRAPTTPGHLKVLVQLHGTCRFRQSGREVELSAGDFIVYEPKADYSMVNPHAVEQIVMSIPAERLALGRNASARVLGRRMLAQSGSGRLAIALLCTTLDELQHCDGQAAAHVAESICRLLVDAVREQAGAHDAVSLKLVLRARVRDFIEANLADPDLCVEQIATTLNCSKRYLHEVFDDTGATLGRYIWKRRLEKCKDELVNGNHPSRSLTEIALSWGFSSPAHFSKAFKQEFGASPREFRSR
jgi:AraC-like DNA-binding protein